MAATVLTHKLAYQIMNTQADVSKAVSVGEKLIFEFDLTELYPGISLGKRVTILYVRNLLNVRPSGQVATDVISFIDFMYGKLPSDIVGDKFNVGICKFNAKDEAEFKFAADDYHAGLNKGSDAGALTVFSPHPRFSSISFTQPPTEREVFLAYAAEYLSLFNLVYNLLATHPYITRLDTNVSKNLAVILFSEHDGSTKSLIDPEGLNSERVSWF